MTRREAGMCDKELHRGKYVCVHDVPCALDTASATTENPGFFDANVSTENPGLFDTKPSSVSWRFSGGPFALQVTSGSGTRSSMMTRKPTVGGGAASSGACGHPSAWPVLRRLPWPRRFLAKAIRGPEPGAQVLEPLHLTRILGSPPDVSLPSLLSFFVFLCLSVCEALKLRSLPFTHPVYVASRYFQ